MSFRHTSTSLVAVAWLFAGCAGSGLPPPQQYTLLGPQERAEETGPGAAPHADLVLRVARVNAPAWLRNTDIHYRLLYHSRSEVGAYTRARWIAPPAQMLQAQVSEALDQGSAWKAVVGPDAPAVADATLHLELLELVQEFESPSESRGVLRFRTTLVNDRDGTVLAQREFGYRIAAPSPDVRGGVDAERQAVRRFARELAAWVAATPIR